MSGWTQEFENALSWFAAAPEKLTMVVGEAMDAVGESVESAAQGVKENVQAAAEWVWVVLQGDFAEEQSTGQIALGTLISVIPYVDQICDVRDFIANCKKIHDDQDKPDDEDNAQIWHWVALILTLIGCFPTLGSLVKGCFKILFKYVRKGLAVVRGKTSEAAWKTITPFVESGIAKLNGFLARPVVRKTLAAMRVDNVYKYLADQIRGVANKLNVGALLEVMDPLIGVLKGMLGFVQKWGDAALQTKAGRLLIAVDDLRKKADAKLAEALKPAQDVLDRLAKRLDLEHEMNYRVTTNAMNPAHFARTSLDAEVEAIKKHMPDWADARVAPKYEMIPTKDVPKAIPPRYFDIHKYKDFENFHTIEAAIIPEGTVLVRVVDPGSNPKGVYWMTQEEFQKLNSKSDWRRRFAVWGNWNGNGEYVTYTVPKGGIPAWRGQAASQQLIQNGKAVKTADGKNIYTEGGGEQLAIDSAVFDDKYLSERQPTNWGYDVAGRESDLVGVPVLKRDKT